jgi:hypothetical protein
MGYMDSRKKTSNQQNRMSGRKILRTLSQTNLRIRPEAAIASSPLPNQNTSYTLTKQGASLLEILRRFKDPEQYECDCDEMSTIFKTVRIDNR